MDARGEAQRCRSATGHVEAIRVVEGPRVPVGAAEQGEDRIARLDHYVVEVDVLERTAAVELDGAVPAQQLLDGALQQRAVLAQPLHLVGVVEQGQEPVADEVGGRLVAQPRR